MERQLLNSLLAIAAVSADSAFLLVTRFTLSCNPLFIPTSHSTSANTLVNTLAGTYK